MNWVDLVIIVILIFFTFEGFGRSIFSESFDLLSFIIAFIISLDFYQFTSRLLENYLSLPRSLANVLGFILLWYLIESLLFALSRLTFLKHVHKTHFPGQKYLSMIPAFLRGFIFVSIILVLIGTFPLQPKIKKQVNDSLIGSQFLNRAYKLEVPLQKIFGGLANDSINFLTVKPKTNEILELGFKTNNFFYDSKMEEAMIGLVNKERVSRNLKPLETSPSLRPVARSHSNDMFQRGYFSHYSPEGKSVADRADNAKINYLVIGENLAYAPSLEVAHNGLMNSPGHKANILSEDYHRIGVGVANANEYGIMFTQIFSN